MKIYKKTEQRTDYMAFEIRRTSYSYLTTKNHSVRVHTDILHIPSFSATE